MAPALALSVMRTMRLLIWFGNHFDFPEPPVPITHYPRPLATSRTAYSHFTGQKHKKAPPSCTGM
jgi:hypothetical protein